MQKGTRFVGVVYPCMGTFFFYAQKCHLFSASQSFISRPKKQGTTEKKTKNDGTSEVDQTTSNQIISKHQAPLEDQRNRTIHHTGNQPMTTTTPQAKPPNPPQLTLPSTRCMQCSTNGDTALYQWRGGSLPIARWLSTNDETALYQIRSSSKPGWCRALRGSPPWGSRT